MGSPRFPDALHISPVMSSEAAELTRDQSRRSMRINSLLRNPYPPPKNSTNFSTTILSNPVPFRSCPPLRESLTRFAPESTSTPRSISSGDPNGSRLPCTNNAGVCNFGKCASRFCSGLRGGCSGYDSNTNPDASSGSSAASIVACRPPYECPPRNTRPCKDSAHKLRCPSNSLAYLFCHRRKRRSMRTHLPKWQIDT